MGKKINSLLYADDLVILSRSKTGLQNCLNALSLYCDKWKLKINPKKTKIMIFQKRPKKSIDIKFQHRQWVNWNCPRIHLFRYTFNSNRKLYSYTCTLLHAFFSIRKLAILNRLNPNNASQIFDTIVFLILNNNSEVWGNVH